MGARCLELCCVLLSETVRPEGQSWRQSWTTLGNGRALIDRTLHKIKVPRVHRQLLKPLATNTGQQ